MAQETFLDLITKSMQESAQLVRSSLGRSSYVTTREKALKQASCCYPLENLMNMNPLVAAHPQWGAVHKGYSRAFAKQYLFDEKCQRDGRIFLCLDKPCV